ASFSFMSQRVTAATTVLPSGEIVGPPSRWICHDRSAENGFFAASWPKAAHQDESTTSANANQRIPRFVMVTDLRGVNVETQERVGLPAASAFGQSAAGRRARRHAARRRTE